MFIKLTRLDGTPIWINAAFVVTVEPRRGSGSVVVPIGDGLDYDVRESPEAVLAMLVHAPAPTVVPVPAPPGLTKTPEDVSPEPERPEPEVRERPRREAERPSPKSAAPAPKSADPAQKAEVPASAPTDSSDAAQAAEPTPESEAAAEPTPTAEAAAAPEATSAPAPEPAPAPDALDVFAGVMGVEEKKPTRARSRTAAHPRAARKPRKGEDAPLTDELVDRLRKMAPGSVKKLQNTLSSQFGVAEPEAAVQALAAKGVFTLDRDHVLWN